MVTPVVVDTSVLVGWFQDGSGPGSAAARAIRTAHIAGQVDARVLDLGLYEIGNLLVEALRWPAPKAADQLEDLLAICGQPVTLSSAWLRDAATIAGLHDLSFYDAAWVAAAENLVAPLVSVNQKLLAVGLAETPQALVARLGL